MSMVIGSSWKANSLRTLAVILTMAACLLSVSLACAATAYAGDDYPAPWRAPSRPDTIVDKWHMYNRECTSFVAWALHSRNHIELPTIPIAYGNADDWGTYFSSKTNHTPKPGSVAWRHTGNDATGHVAWVRSVSGSNVTVEEYNSSVPYGWDQKTVRASYYTGFIHFKDLPRTGSSPIGHFDSVSGLARGKVRIRGWAIDPDAPAQPTKIQVFIDGPAGVGGHRVDLGRANSLRPDVQRHYVSRWKAVGRFHGIDKTINGISAGPHRFFLYALNAGGGGGSKLIGSKKATVPSGAVAPLGSSTVGTVGPDFAWRLSNRFIDLPAVGPFSYGIGGDIPVAGDWNGDGITTGGVFRASNSTWHLSNGFDGKTSITVFHYGTAGDIPVVGDWNGDGKTTVGVLRPGSFTWHLTNQFADHTDIKPFHYGTAGDIPVAGDWNGDGKDTPGTFRIDQTWHLTNQFVDHTDIKPFHYGTAGDIPVAGDWNGDGKDTPGIFRSDGTWHLTNGFTDLTSIVPFHFGGLGDVPVVGDWDNYP